MPRDEDDRPRRKRRDEEEDDDRPRRRRRDEEEDEDRPRRRRRDDDEDEEEDRPRRRRRDEDEDEDDYAPRRGRRLSREALRGIAGSQKAIIACIAIQICLVLAQFAIPENIRMFMAIPLLLTGAAAAVFVFLLATKVYATATGVILGVLTLIPCIGLIVLLIINGKATSILKENGISVGLFGASLSDI